MTNNRFKPIFFSQKKVEKKKLYLKGRLHKQKFFVTVINGIKL